ncbi:N-acetylmuramoyl-L-alanine amidase [Bacillus tianshenii]|nr:N-acetylmuramoyl-L-alanine amidase [Bacillus tianshenii]
MKSALSLASKLKQNGANVILTRSDDRYITLNYRVDISHYYDADAFLSLHYDSTGDKSVNGIGSFYYSKQKDYPLAEAIQRSLIQQTGHTDRQARYGNYHVLRENRQPAALIELGFLSNANEEAIIKTNDFQSKAVEGIYKGLVNFFKQS